MTATGAPGNRDNTAPKGGARARAKLADHGCDTESRTYPHGVAGSPVQGAVPILSRVPGYVVAMAGLALTSGTIHIVAAVEHIDVNVMLSAFFALVGIGQVVAAWWLFRNPEHHRALKLAAVGSVAVSLLWVFSRTTGIPFGPEPGRAAVGVADTITTLQQFALAAIVVALLRSPERRDRGLRWLSSGMGSRFTSAMLSATLLIAAVGGHEH